jgi:D-alanine transaminase
MMKYVGLGIRISSFDILSTFVIRPSSLFCVSTRWGKMHALANLNGEIISLTEARIPALDRGFLFGDAVYEVLRVYEGRPWLEDGHFHRLERSLRAVRMPAVDLDRLRQRMRETIAAGPFQDAVVYIQITRGAAPRSHPFPAHAVPLEFLFVQEFADSYSEARKSGAKVITHPDLRWDRCDIKSTNLLANVLAMQAAKEADGLEALLYLPDGTLTEGTHTSFFGVLEGTVLTAPNSNAILPGITRGLILQLAAQAHIPVREHVLKRSDLEQVSELFLTGTTSEVLPVVSVDRKPIGEGRPGPVTRRLQQAYEQAVRDFVAEQR